jgi:hypothetical protein
MNSAREISLSPVGNPYTNPPSSSPQLGNYTDHAILVVVVVKKNHA